MMMPIRPMIYSNASYLLILINTSPSRLKIFLIVRKENPGLLLGYYSCYSQELTLGKKSPPESGTNLNRNIAGTEIFSLK